ncbi:MAG: CbtA family protein [Alphaproteobacteria bacterium]|jgi:cobalt transporter subunit CbtA|nr:CbtA family protein [Alphaproteobacteria bacterium]MDP6813257.1 CbtA family protein [Alphaproteobacteria bacterium]
MFRTILLVALIAGVVAGLLVTGVQALKVLPLIHQAEVYEEAGGHAHGAAPGQDDKAAAHRHEDEAWQPADGVERFAFTLLFNILAGIGFALLLTAAYSIKGGRDWREGFLWGLAGFAAFNLAPAFGLPPELPGMPAAEVGPRQIWWVGTMAATLAGIGILVYVPPTVWKLAAVAIIVLPHVIGAPHPRDPSAAVPATIAASFVSASLVSNLLFWLTIGGVAAYLFRRLSPKEVEEMSIA